MLELRVSQRGNPMLQAMAVGELASYEYVRGRPTRALEYLTELIQIQDQLGVTFIDEPELVLDALTEVLSQVRFIGNPTAAKATLDALTADPSWQGLEPQHREELAFAALYAEAGYPDQARELMERFESEAPMEFRDELDSRTGLHQARAAIALAEGRANEALAEYRASRELRPGCSICDLTEIGMAHDLAGQPDSAIASLEQYLETPFLYRSGIDNLNLPVVLIRLGELYEQQGNRERAIEYYNRFVDLWQDAEPQLQPRVSEIRNRIARLVGETG
jgi:tetratricopeptide (TPR) repeat protein